MPIVSILALIILIVSVVLAIVAKDWRSPTLWALWSIAVAVIFGGGTLVLT